MRRWLCYALSLLRLHSPDCRHCHAGEVCWPEMRRRLEELNWPNQPYPPRKKNEQAVEDSVLLARRKSG